MPLAQIISGNFLSRVLETTQFFTATMSFSNITNEIIYLIVYYLNFESEISAWPKQTVYSLSCGVFPDVIMCAMDTAQP